MQSISKTISRLALQKNENLVNFLEICLLSGCPEISVLHDGRECLVTTEVAPHLSNVVLFKFSWSPLSKPLISLVSQRRLSISIFYHPTPLLLPMILQVDFVASCITSLQTPLDTSLPTTRSHVAAFKRQRQRQKSKVKSKKTEDKRQITTQNTIKNHTPFF